MRFRLLLLGAIVTVPLAFAACGNPGTVKAREDALRTELAKAQSMGAKDCAPEELAKAEANLEFGQIEIKQGDYIRAEDHFEEGFKMAKAAQRGVRNCKRAVVAMNTPTPKPVVVVLTPTPSPSPSSTATPVVSPSPTPTPEPSHTPIIVVVAPTATPTATQVVIIHSTPTPSPSATPDVSKIDSDGDGVPDIKDECPADPGPATNSGCPVKDTDGDGIPDPQDQCPQVPGVLQYHGCPVPDKDKDGVPDDQDKCPDAPGLPANGGCPPATPDLKFIVIDNTKKTIDLKQQIHFQTGKSVILPDSNQILDEIVKVMKDHTTMEIRIEGHTDSTGTPTGNLALSKARADACRTYLVNAGVDGNRLRAVGLGQTTPIADNRSPEGRALNRRVEFHITHD